MMIKKPILIRLSMTLGLLAVLSAGAESTNLRRGDPAQHFHTDTPIKHVIVIFQENVSFDHYFATYPHALNTTAGEPQFFAKPGTPTVNNLESAGLLTLNPNSTAPFRLGRKQCETNDNDHGYKDEQAMFDGGLMDKFVQNNHGTATPAVGMAYVDGNTVTALWNYAQHFALSDNFYGTTFGPSTPGHVNLVSGQTHGVVLGTTGPSAASDVVSDGAGGLTLIDDAQPTGDIATTRDNVSLLGKNVGDLLNGKGITWGYFQGGFRPAGGFVGTGPTHTAPDPDPTNPAALHHTPKVDYIPHHQPFQYYPSTANPKHLPPSSVAMIGQTDAANHQYDLSDFWDALDAHALPAVSYLKPPGYQDGHAGYSDPLAEQTFLVDTINRIQLSEEWESTAIILTWDDSDGWYDHQMGPIVKQSHSPADALLGPGNSGNPPPGGFQGMCGYGPRIPCLVISPFAKKNFVDHSITDQSSILRFVEDNWDLGRLGDGSFNGSFDAFAGTLENMFDFRHGPHPHRLFLDPATGLPVDE
ncbi:MAG TPA: alkaline phosphatase family protein [Planctomycetota bacterium]|nr:alkaline phosphatase family protein [Planctomycetota bacterium]